LIANKKQLNHGLTSSRYGPHPAIVDTDYVALKRHQARLSFFLSIDTHTKNTSWPLSQNKFKST